MRGKFFAPQQTLRKVSWIRPRLHPSFFHHQLPIALANQVLARSWSWSSPTCLRSCQKKFPSEIPTNILIFLQKICMRCALLPYKICISILSAEVGATVLKLSRLRRRKYSALKVTLQFSFFSHSLLHHREEPLHEDVHQLLPLLPLGLRSHPALRR